MMINLSNKEKVSEERAQHVVDIASVTSGKSCHTTQADILPFPQNDGIVLARECMKPQQTLT